MSDTKRAFNFNPGPALIPEAVIAQAQRDLWSYGSTGLGIMEISHRSKEFEALLAETKQDLRDLLQIPNNYEILFISGGATQQFSMVPLNLGDASKEANYLVAGIWGDKAQEEARKFCPVHIAGSSKEGGFRSIPKNLNVSNNPSYLHFTSNNTVMGTQHREEPEAGGAPLICDASSDLLSRPIPVERYGLIYACAQKNLGPTGITVVILRSDLLARSPKDLPILLDYNTYAKTDSLYNTIPTFPVYVVGLVLKWLKNIGGLSEIEARNNEKARMIYDFIDSHPFYRGHAEREDRSTMNVSFFTPSAELDTKFVAEANILNLKGLKGHKILGGLRASIYNAFPREGVESLVEFMDKFAKQNS